jgi:hypothetical protein
MKTAHYIITNSNDFNNDTKAVEKLNCYLNDIESIFPEIEKVFGNTWQDSQINIELNDSKGGALYIPGDDVVKMGIYNRNIQKEYPENLWGCLFHETHHAFLNQILKNRKDREIFNGGCNREVFNYSFMATTYFNLREKNIIDEQLYQKFLNKLERELKDDDAVKLFKEYNDMIFKKSDNFSKFISVVKTSDLLFVDRNKFRKDLDEIKKLLN